MLVGGLILTELIAGIYYTVKENIKSEVIEESEETVYTVPVSEEYPVLVSEGNKAYTEKYTIACDMTTEVDFGSIPPDEGNIYLAFHITVDNISEKSSCNFGIPSCFADGVECSMIPFTDKGIFLVTGLGAGESYEGWSVFEVPSDAEYFELNFDDEVIIYKENILNEEE